MFGERSAASGRCQSGCGLRLPTSGRKRIPTWRRSCQQSQHPDTGSRSSSGTGTSAPALGDAKNAAGESLCPDFRRSQAHEGLVQRAGAGEQDPAMGSATAASATIARLCDYLLPRLAGWNADSDLMGCGVQRKMSLLGPDRWRPYPQVGLLGTCVAALLSVHPRFLREVTVEPFGAIALLGAKYGVRKLATALLGDDSGAEADLAQDLVGLIIAAEQSQARLAEIERRLDIVINQRYKVSSGIGLRYLRQAMLGGRSAGSRHDDLVQAEASLIEASEASITPFQRALCERLLIVVRFAVRDQSGARDSQVWLDLALGEAAQQAWQQIARVWEPDRGVQRGEVSTRWLLERTIAVFRNADPEKAVWESMNAELSAVGGLLGDAAILARMLDMPSPTRAPRIRRVDSGAPIQLEFDVVVDAPIRIGGVTCTIEQIALKGPPVWAVQVQVDPRRSGAVHAHWTSRIRTGSASVFGQRHEVEPGTTVRLASHTARNMPENVEHSTQSMSDWPEKMEVQISGMMFFASTNPFQ